MCLWPINITKTLNPEPRNLNNMKVPFIDLKAQYESIKPEIDDAIQQVLDSCAFAGGPFVEAFEKQFAEFCKCDSLAF